MKYSYLVLDREGKKRYTIYGSYSSLKRAYSALDKVAKCGCKTGVVVRMVVNKEPELNNIQVINK